ncbi:MAG: hypothetical protein KDD47_28380, partial [Acidobacteria bacterium]|nr:hypothetical protein [Acidobacteriota bacterium]
MEFKALALSEALGCILGHNVAGPDGRRALRKGRPLSEGDLEVLRGLGRETIHVARLEAGDVEENTAAGRIASALAGEGLRLSRPATGRVNLHGERLGLLRLDLDRLRQLNELFGVTLATLEANTPVPPGKMAATLKIIPYALPETVVHEAEILARSGGPLVRIHELSATRTGLILTGSDGSEEKVVAGFRRSLGPRLAALGSTIESVEFVTVEDDAAEERLAATLGKVLSQGVDLVILAGETAIMDRHDLAPRALEAVGGEVELFGAPVDPGNLLLIGYRGRAAVVGAPGCARSPKVNIV